MSSFSERNGCQPQNAEIAIRQEAPEEMRGVVVDLAYESGLGPKELRTLVCRLLRRREDPNNWSPYPNVDWEIRGLVDSCEWYEVYDVIEAIDEELRSSSLLMIDGQPAAMYFEVDLNKYFRRRGFGWQINHGLIEARGAEEFEHTLNEARQELSQSGRTTASNEIHEAIHDLSRRPHPDVTGAIQHSLAALECIARDVTGDSQATLGAILRRHPGLVPAPLDQALEKLWGFASEQGRHLREGRVPGYEEAEVSVQVSSAVARYLSKKFSNSLG